MGEWISVKDRLPEKSGSYLVVGKSGGAYVTHFWEKSEYNKEAHFSSPYVTHWQERPKVPYRPKPDVVEVVRCKDCKFSSFIKSCSKYECKKSCGSLKFSNDYCSYGEQKENEVDPNDRTI